MKFVDPLGQDPGTTRTAFHMMDADIQVAIEDLDQVMAEFGFILIVMAAAEGTIELSIRVIS